MALKGSLKDISPSDLIQLNCQSGSQACLVLTQGDETINIYFDGGEIVHAQFGEEQGEQVVYRMLAWDNADFEVERDVRPPVRSIDAPWSVLMMEGLRRADETRHNRSTALSGNPLKTALSELASHSSFYGLAVVSREGVLLADELQSQSGQGNRPDAKRIGAVASSLIGLSVRSVGQLECGELLQTLIQGSGGNIILSQAGPTAVLVALTDQTANLGMAFLEAREGARIIAELLG